MKTTKEKMKVMQAFLDGELIQRQHVDYTESLWHTLGTEPVWDWLSYDFRVKPEPRVIWVNEYDSYEVAHCSKGSAETGVRKDVTRVAVQYREVIGEE